MLWLLELVLRVLGIIKAGQCFQLFNVHNDYITNHTLRVTGVVRSVRSVWCGVMLMMCVLYALCIVYDVMRTTDCVSRLVCHVSCMYDC